MAWTVQRIRTERYSSIVFRSQNSAGQGLRRHKLHVFIAGRFLSLTAPSLLIPSAHFRQARVKCSGESPSCKRCLDKGKQCGYHKSTTTRWQAQVAAARDSTQNLSAGAALQSLERDITDHQVLAPRNDAWNLPVLAPWNNAWNLPDDQGLRRSTTASSPTLTNGIHNYPLDLPVQDPVQAFYNPWTNQEWPR